MRVPMLDPAKCNLRYQQELEEAALRILRSGQFILGDEVESFEREAAFYLDVKHALAVSSGTDALLLALMANDIGPGDEVICPSFTFFATAGSIARVGATPVFVDIEYDTFNVDPDSIERAITTSTKAIIPVHLFGQSADMKRISAIAKANNLIVIEDACQSIGALQWGTTDGGYKRVGSFGDVGCFSFFPSKNLGGFGDGGLVTTNNDALYKKMLQLRVHGGTRQYYHDMIGGNFRMDALQAGLLKVKLFFYDRNARESNMLQYNDALAESMYVLPKQINDNIHVWNQYTIRVPDGKRDDLKEYLGKHSIASGIYYPLPLHLQPCFQQFNDGCHLPVTEATCKECLSLPIASELTDLQIDYVITRLQLFEKGDR